MAINIVPWNERLLEEIQQDESRQAQTLFIERHPQYPTYALVNSFTDGLAAHLDILNDYQAVPLLKLDQLYQSAEQAGFSDVVLLEDKDDILGFLNGLDDPYPCELNVSLKKFQLQGFNYTKDLPAAIINWSTGTGKSIYAVARVKYMLEAGIVDKVIIASKNHNKINWQRTLKNIGNLNSAIDEVAGGSAAKKREARAKIYKDNSIFIVNYEKFRFHDDKVKAAGGDGQEISEAIQGLRVLWIWDEMPSKLKSMSTAHYRGIAKILKKTKQNWQVSLTATKIETDPENIYTCMKLLDPQVWPNKQSFRQMYAKSMSTFSPWQVATWDRSKLHELGMRISHMTHVANKYTDPDISAEFPEDHWDDVLIDMSTHDRVLYDAALSDLIADLPKDYSSILTKMSILQMICNNPSSVNKSDGELARALVERNNFTDKYSAKLDTLKEMVESIDGKIVLFSMFNDFGARMLMPYLVQWNVPFVLYNGSAKQKQEAEDKFRHNRRIKVFLSSDQGSDSINLEKATTVINYDLPWNYSTLVQRVNRISRLTSEAEHVFYYNLIMANTIEERKLSVLNRKKEYEELIDQPLSAGAEILASNSVEDLKWILLGS